MSSEGQEEEDSGDKYQKLLDSWDDLLDEDEEEEQDETNVHKRAVQPILNEFLRPYVNEYIRSYNNVQKREEIKARINGIMNDFKDRVDNQDLDDFSRLVFNQVYKKLYDRWYESVVKNFNKMSDMQEDAYLEMLQPFKNNLVWKTLMPGISGRETLAQHRERPKVSVMPEQEKKRQQEERKKKIETEKAQTQKEENIEAESAQKKARQSEKGKAKLPPPISPASLGAFKYKEVYQIAGYKPWSSRLLIISEPENMRDLNQIYKQAIDAVIDSEKIVRLDDLILLRQKARFWIEEFFNHIISPCQFTTPTILQCDDKFNVYRSAVMIPLIVLAQVLPLLNNQLTLISNLEKDIVKDEMERLKQTIMSPSEWREYLSINFPESAMAFFNEVPASGSEKGKTALRKAHEKYDRLLPILTRIQEMFVLPPPKPVVAAPFIPEAKKRTREIEAPVVVEAVEPATEKKGKVETLEEKRTRVKNEFNKTMENIEQHKLKGGQYWMYDTYMGGDVPGNKLSYEDMDILMTPNSCLNNFIINYFLKELQNHYTNKHVAVLLTNDLTSYQDSQDKPQVVAKIRNSSNLSQDTSVILVPVNVVPSQGKPAHWVLYAVDLNGGGIYIYDSLSGYAEEEQNKLLTSLVDFLRDLGIENPKWTIFTVFDKPLQEDGTSCGVYLTVFVEGFLQGFKNWDKLQKVKNMNRLRYLLQYQILLKEFISVEDLVPK